MSTLTAKERALLDAGTVRHHKISVLHREGRIDAERAHTLVGKRCTKFDTTYEITRVHYSFDGCIAARGYKIVAGDKRGSKVWDIGLLAARNFE